MASTMEMGSVALVKVSVRARIGSRVEGKCKGRFECKGGKGRVEG